MFRIESVASIALLAMTLAAPISSEPPRAPALHHFTITGSGFQAGQGYFFEWIRSSVAHAPRHARQGGATLSPQTKRPTAR